MRRRGACGGPAHAAAWPGGRRAACGAARVRRRGVASIAHARGRGARRRRRGQQNARELAGPDPGPVSSRARVRAGNSAAPAGEPAKGRPAPRLARGR